MFSASKPLLSPASLPAMAVRPPPYLPARCAPYSRPPPFCSVARATPLSLRHRNGRLIAALYNEEGSRAYRHGHGGDGGGHPGQRSPASRRRRDAGLSGGRTRGGGVVWHTHRRRQAHCRLCRPVVRPCGSTGRNAWLSAVEKRLYGAICAAPAIVLMPWGLHRGKKVTCHPSFIGDLPTFRAVESNVQVSGELTTSRGPGTAFQFALSFVKQLFGTHAAEDMESTLMAQIDADLERSTEVNKVEWSFDHNPQVLIPIANGSEEMEIVMLTDILRRANINVVLASVEKSTSIVGSQRMEIVADKCILDVSESKYDLIILPGGPAGAERMHTSKILQKLLKEQKQACRMYGGVSYSPLILQRQGLLQDKKATAHPAVVNQLTCQVIDQSKVVIDGNLITGKGLGTVIDFSLAIIRKFFGHRRAKLVATGIVF